MFAEQIPFKECTSQARLLALILTNGRPKVPISDVPQELNSLICACWDQEPSNRPDMTLVMEKLTMIEKNIANEQKSKIISTTKGMHVLQINNEVLDLYLEKELKLTAAVEGFQFIACFLNNTRFHCKVAEQESYVNN